MLTVMQPPAAAESLPTVETVIESQDDRWVVIARYCERTAVVRTRTRSFATYPQARQYEVDLKTGRAA